MKEENINPEPCCVMIHFLPPKEEWDLPKEQQNINIRISVNGYTKVLTRKIQESFTIHDFELLNKKLDNIAQIFRN